MANMETSKTQFQAFLAQKCPKCRQGDMFKSSTYNLLSFGAVHTNCTVCNLHFEREPGFFTGAMYFSYGINVAIIAIVGICTQFFFQPDIFVLVGVVTFATIAFIPFTFRYSRMMMMYLFSGATFDSTFADRSPKA